MDTSPQRSVADLEAEIARLKEQQSAAAHELDAFLYAVSHDLRAPLRSLSGFSQALLESQDLDADQRRHYLERIQQASRKLAELIDALLSLSRISRADLNLRTVDVSTACAQAVTVVAAKYPERRVTVTIAPGLTAVADHRLLRLALEQLLDNAFKFTAARAAPAIEIGRNARGEFYIADNGVGFDIALQDKLFRPFQRLHADPQFAGTGIGLAMVHRILARHGGSIRLEPRSGGGATALFTLPGSGNA